MLKTAARWIFNKEGKKHGLNKKVIVSLTSYPARFNTLPLTLKNIFTQSVKPDVILLAIAEEDIPFLTKEIRGFEKLGLTIFPCKDLKSYNKIFPALQLYPTDYICTADDDVYYKTKWLEELVEGIKTESNNVATCHRCHRIASDENNTYLPYKTWEKTIFERGKLADLFPTGVGGILYPPNAIKRDGENLISLCPTADDVLLFWFAKMNGIQYKAIGKKERSKKERTISWKGSQETALYKINNEGEKNDLQIKKLGEVFGYPNIN